LKQSVRETISLSSTPTVAPIAVPVQIPARSMLFLRDNYPEKRKKHRFNILMNLVILAGFFILNSEDRT
jgi:hypothetical protein